MEVKLMEIEDTRRQETRREVKLLEIEETRRQDTGREEECCFPVLTPPEVTVGWLTASLDSVGCSAEPVRTWPAKGQHRSMEFI